MPPGQRVEFTFSIDLPDVNVGIPAAFRFSSVPGGPIDSYFFTLREIPTVPEPSTLFLISVGGLACLIFCWWSLKKGFVGAAPGGANQETGARDTASGQMGIRAGAPRPHQGTSL